MAKAFNHKPIIAQRMTVQVTRSERMQRAGGSVSWGSVDDGTLTGTVELFIDIGAIMKQLGGKALHSKGKKARAMRGAIEMRASNLVRIPLD